VNPAGASTTSTQSPPRTSGKLVHSARAYDLLVWILLGGRGRAYYRRLLDLAQVTPGQVVLDIGCGTGSLAIAATRRVGDAGLVYGIDGAVEMIEHARRKAAKARVDATFTHAVVEEIPFPDDHFDTILCSLMFHHLRRAVREQCAREMYRVLKPGGKGLVVEFSRDGKSVISRLHKHAALELSGIHDVLRSAGFDIAESGLVGIQGLNYTLAAMPGSP